VGTLEFKAKLCIAVTKRRFELQRYVTKLRFELQRYVTKLRFELQRHNAKNAKGIKPCLKQRYGQ
jgi:hypothetical protein